jgi:hypothetical protein
MVGAACPRSCRRPKAQDAVGGNRAVLEAVASRPRRCPPQLYRDRGLNVEKLFRFEEDLRGEFKRRGSQPAEELRLPDHGHRPVQYLNNVLAQDHRADQAGPRESAFSLLLGSLAHDRRLRSDSYDPQRPGVLECGGCEGRSAAPLHSRLFAAMS